MVNPPNFLRLGNTEQTVFRGCADGVIPTDTTWCATLLYCLLYFCTIALFAVLLAIYSYSQSRGYTRLHVHEVWYQSMIIDRLLAMQLYVYTLCSLHSL